MNRRGPSDSSGPNSSSWSRHVLSSLRQSSWGKGTLLEVGVGIGVKVRVRARVRVRVRVRVSVT